MSSRQPNHRRVKIHRTYSVEEVADVLDVHKNTVRQWLRQGLETIDSRRPLLVSGETLKGFLAKRRHDRKQPCRPGEIYCFGCKQPRRPTGDTVYFNRAPGNRDSLIGECPTCHTRLHRRTSAATLSTAAGTLTVIDLPSSLPAGPLPDRIVEGT